MSSKSKQEIVLDKKTKSLKLIDSKNRKMIFEELRPTPLRKYFETFDYVYSFEGLEDLLGFSFTFKCIDKLDIITIEKRIHVNQMFIQLRRILEEICNDGVDNFKKEFEIKTIDYSKGTGVAKLDYTSCIKELGFNLDVYLKGNNFDKFNLNIYGKPAKILNLNFATLEELKSFKNTLDLFFKISFYKCFIIEERSKIFGCKNKISMDNNLFVRIARQHNNKRYYDYVFKGEPCDFIIVKDSFSQNKTLTLREVVLRDIKKDKLIFGNEGDLETFEFKIEDVYSICPAIYDEENHYYEDEAANIIFNNYVLKSNIMLKDFKRYRTSYLVNRYKSLLNKIQLFNVEQENLNKTIELIKEKALTM